MINKGIVPLAFALLLYSGTLNPVLAQHNQNSHYFAQHRNQKQEPNLPKGWHLKKAIGKKGEYKVDDGLAFLVANNQGITAFHIQDFSGNPITSRTLYEKNALTATVSFFGEGTKAKAMLDNLIRDLFSASSKMYRHDIVEGYMVTLPSMFLGGYISSGGTNIAKPLVSSSGNTMIKSLSDNIESKIKLEESACKNNQDCIREYITSADWQEEALENALKLQLRESIHLLKEAKSLVLRSTWNNRTAKTFYKKFYDGFVSAAFYTSAWQELNNKTIWKQITKEIIPSFGKGISGNYSVLGIISKINQKIKTDPKIRAALDKADREADSTAKNLSKTFEIYWDTSNPRSNASFYLKDCRKGYK